VHILLAGALEVLFQDKRFHGAAASSPTLADLTDAVGKSAVILVFGTSEAVPEVIATEMNILGHDEIQRNAEGVRKAMLDELGRWTKLKAWQRMPRNRSRNLLDSRWVIKWKSVDEVKVLRARLTARGFLDRQSTVLQTHAGTTTRWGQRLVAIFAAEFGWILRSADVSQAFLRGLTFADLARIPGECHRVVEVELPPGSASVLRLLPEFSDFDQDKEVLQLLRPGFGLKDAPRLWGLALKRALAAAGLTATRADFELFVKHDWSSGSARLCLIVSTHVDDLKYAGDDHETKLFVKALESQFDSMKLEERSFLHCGIQHDQDPRNFSVTMDQVAYAQQMRLIDEIDLQQETSLVNDAKKTAFRSLLGGVSWMSQTRMDAQVYTGHLQRQLQAPTVRHVVQLNRLVRYLKKKPLKLKYQKLGGPFRVLVVSDSSFKAEEFSGFAVKAGVVLLAREGEGIGGMTNAVEWISKRQSHVCRSTYAAEMHSLLDTAATGHVIRLAIFEILHGAQSASTSLEMIEEIYNAVPLDVAIDAKSLYDGSTNFNNIPNEKALILHQLAIREKLQSREYRALYWLDTRDCVSDGLNKGSVDRSELRELSESGKFNVRHEFRRFEAPRKIG